MLATAFPTLGAPFSTTETLLNWSDWENYRNTVQHPVLGTKPADIRRARANMQRHSWAQEYVNSLEKTVSRYTPSITPEFLRRMILATTPLSSVFTPCPACRDQKKPYQPHGSWQWDPDQSEQLQCRVCKTIYPNQAYPETIELRSRFDPAQSFSYFGGEPFPVFQWKHGRPSFSGNIRSRKVSFMATLARNSASAYTLTGKPIYAEACRKILLRFAEVYPGYLVHCAYGEVADLSPREAALSLKRLPVSELTYPPNKPDYALFKHFWTAGRAAGTGIEGYLIRQWVETYDLTCEATTTQGLPIYTPADRRNIERNLLLESTILPIADPQINNKSVANRSAVGLVGIALGHPAMARQGLESFREMVDNWFLPDGGTPESISYGLMAISGVRDLSLAFREYSDPPGYLDPDGKRYDTFNIFRDSNYPRIWKAFLDCLQPDLSFPPFADSRYRTRFPPADAEILPAVYPEEPRYVALLAELTRRNGNPVDPATAIYLRSPGFSTSAAPALSFPDHCLPNLRIGYMRGGTSGRESLLLLNASHWGIHHHADSLNLYYWKNGHELLTDLGYLWDHADEEMTFRTFAHNLVILDGKEQDTRTRGGEVEWFHAGNHLKAMRASSQAYPKAEMYRRTAALVDHGNGNSYAVDLFEVEGGITRDYVYHGPATVANTRDFDAVPTSATLYDLTNVSTAETTAPWTIQWKLAKNMTFTAWNVPQENETAFVGSGWGQRDSNNRDRGTTIPYIIRRMEGNQPSKFITVFEGNPPRRQFIRYLKRLAIRSDPSEPELIALEVKTRTGTDYITWKTPGSATGTLPGGISVRDAPLSVLSTRNGRIRWTESVPMPGFRGPAGSPARKTVQKSR